MLELFEAIGIGAIVAITGTLVYLYGTTLYQFYKASQPKKKGKRKVAKRITK